MSLTNPSTYTEVKAALDAIAEDTSSAKAATETFIGRIRTIQADLLAMQSKWTVAVQYIDAQATANAGDPDWDRASSEKGKLVADFLAEKARVDALLAAIDAV